MSPNHALQRTRATVTATAAHHLRPPAAFPQCPRPWRVSLSLGSLGVATRIP